MTEESLKTAKYKSGEQRSASLAQAVAILAKLLQCDITEAIEWWRGGWYE